MGKREAEFEGFLRGLGTAQKLAEEAEEEGKQASGAIEHRIRLSRSTGVTLPMKRKDLHLATVPMKAYTIKTVLAVSLIALHEEFRFGKQRLYKFMQEYNRYADELTAGRIDWVDILDYMKDETGIEVEMPRELMQQKMTMD